MKTSNGFRYYSFALLGISLVIFFGCEMKETPLLSTTEVTKIRETTAVSGGNITDDGGAPVIVRGVCWSTNQNPTIHSTKTEDGPGAGSFTSSISTLEPNTTYFVRAYATNTEGTGYGEQVSFKTILIIYGEGVTDIDGNEYITVIIGEQEWMAENLKTTTYNNGDPIPTWLDAAQWSETTEGAYAIYPHTVIDGLNSDAKVLDAYGALYNWYAVETSNLCPTGWHIPTDAEWTILTEFVGGESVAGVILRSTRAYPDAHPRWDSPNTGATDQFGFSALPGGYRSGIISSFSWLGGGGHWWSSTVNNDNYPWCRYVVLDVSNFHRINHLKNIGISARCIKDQ